MPKYNERGSSSQRGYGSKWQGARELYLAQNPFCADHKERGRDVIATVVDHKIAPKLFEAKQSRDPERITRAHKLFWDRNNWQGLCKLCHDSHKQRLEKSGVVIGCDVDGIPIDSNHHWSGGGG
ncbi:hypothetical protein SAMN05216302_101449 [Nitrosomonas aestuarii]|uniref:HNH endonuclease n=1 Tax=Nitrosomonas aestuarii TaxID=52441 RepID=A0A1I4C3T9_9PROT|nr:HNH endonuclease [Nitrosomonas aestuarii]SFK74856.1 hypothetical protein SAMN05216302_101449 [Nitrosomonas aestuarii]